MVCDERIAPFGFNTRAGMVWTCQEHRDARQAVVVPPAWIGRAAGTV